ncbi:MAG: thermonuclease family protein [Crocinitomicaceae bacterium]
MNDFLYHYKARVLSVYDGDTARVAIDLGFGIEWKGSDGRGLSIRLFGLDAPEIRGSEREDGLKSRDALREKILEKTIVLKTIKDATGKYGRYLGVILSEEGLNVNEWLIENGFAEAKEY